MTQIDIYATSDVHGHWAYRSREGELVGGIGQLILAADSLDHERALLLDNGDTINGAWFASYLVRVAKRTDLLADALAAVGFDSFVPGNHDFDYGLQVLQYFQDAMPDTVFLAANLRIADTSEQPFQSVQVFERSGVKIAVIGIANAATGALTPWEHASNLHFDDVVTTLNMEVAAIRSEVDLVIVSYHGGVERNLETGEATQYPNPEDETWRILSSVKGIDGIIAGHQHRASAGIYRGAGSAEVVYAQPGYAGEYLAKLSFEVADGTVKVRGGELVKTADLVAGTSGGSGAGLRAETEPATEAGFDRLAKYQEINRQFSELDANFNVWLKTEAVSPAEVAQFLTERFFTPMSVVALPSHTAKRTPTWQDLADIFRAPYQAFIMQMPLSEFETGIDSIREAGLVIEISGERAGESAAHYVRFVTNLLGSSFFHPSRIMSKSVANIFDELLGRS
ncbi:MAG: metallophosphoesterase [Microbacteriaceae bacterium]|nr:metallophosphoesterase [Microbacteriaceae bacterium]